MSNMMPFIMSSPPPIEECEEEEDDEFGDFSAADHNFSITDLNQMNDSPEIEEPWTDPSTINTEDAYPGISSKNLSENTLKEALKDSYIKVLENHSHIQGSDGIMCETSNSSYCENENSQSSDVEVQPFTTNNFSFVDQAENINLNPQPLINDTIIDCVNDLSRIQTHEEAYGGEVKRGKVESHSESISDIKKEAMDASGDDFSEFADFTSSLSNFENGEVKESEGLEVNVTQAEDDFDEFDDFESAVFTSNSVKEELTLEETLKMMFENPKGNSNEPTSDTPKWKDSLHSCLDDSSSVWGHLKELETSHALSYQWSDSVANKKLLSSLNIDCRNILFGARWNSSIPRFAANLGVNPLEPVKATEISSLPQVSSPSTDGTTEEVVPAAQFDWTNSGLTNPLDGLEKENASSSAEEPAMSAVVDALVVDSVKPIVDDIFGSLCEEVIDQEENESATLTILHPTVSSISEFESRRKNEISSEAYAIVESFPDLSFLSARKLMHVADENMSRWRLRP